MPVNKILVVDDDEDDFVLLVKTLSASNQQYELHLAKDGDECVAKAVSESPDLILMDLMMPRISGGEVAQLLKDNPQTAEVPIFFLSGATNSSDPVGQENRGINVGGVFYPSMGKPFTVEELKLCIDKYIT